MHPSPSNITGWLGYYRKTWHCYSVLLIDSFGSWRAMVK